MSSAEGDTRWRSRGARRTAPRPRRGSGCRTRASSRWIQTEAVGDRGASRGRAARTPPPPVRAARPTSRMRAAVQSSASSQPIRSQPASGLALRPRAAHRVEQPVGRVDQLRARRGPSRRGWPGRDARDRARPRPAGRPPRPRRSRSASGRARRSPECAGRSCAEPKRPAAAGASDGLCELGVTALSFASHSRAFSFGGAAAVRGEVHHMTHDHVDHAGGPPVFTRAGFAGAVAFAVLVADPRSVQSLFPASSPIPPSAQRAHSQGGRTLARGRPGSRHRLSSR